MHRPPLTLQRLCEVALKPPHQQIEKLYFCLKKVTLQLGVPLSISVPVSVSPYGLACAIFPSLPLYISLTYLRPFRPALRSLLPLFLCLLQPLGSLSILCLHLLSHSPSVLFHSSILPGLLFPNILLCFPSLPAASRSLFLSPVHTRVVS